MLYVSRRIGRDKFAIMDTDDNTETVASWKQLSQYVNMGIEITGVHTKRRFSFEDSKYVIDIFNVLPWQPEETISVNQTKAKVIHGVDIMVSNGVVTGIKWNDSAVKPGTRVRLSNFGTKCGDSVVDPFRGQSHNYIVLVLDDKIRVGVSSFLGIYRYPDVCLDISEVTNKRVVDLVYRTWGDSEFPLDLDKCIIDKPERKIKYEALSFVMYNIVSERNSFPREVENFVSDTFYDEFLEFATSRFSPKPDSASRTEFNWFLYDMQKDYDFWMQDGQFQYLPVRRKDGLKVFELLKKTTTCNVRTLKRFQNYMTYFDATIKMQQVYVLLCKRVYQWCLTGRKGW